MISVSCRQNVTFDRYTSTPLGWGVDQPIEYKFEIIDTVEKHNLYLKLRTTENYPFSNLFLQVDLYYPNGQIQKDTLEFLMATPEGKMLGDGYGSVKEHKLWYKGHNSPFFFTQKGEYTISISHANRELGQVEGLDFLEGVIDVGFSVETK